MGVRVLVGLTTVCSPACVCYPDTVAFVRASGLVAHYLDTIARRALASVFRGVYVAVSSNRSHTSRVVTATNGAKSF